MEAVLSAGFIPRADAFVAVLHCLDEPDDPAIDLALRQTTTALEPYWRPAMDAGELQFAKLSHRDYAELGAGLGLEGRLAEFLNERSPSRKDIAAIQEQLLNAGTDVEVRMVVTALTRGGGLRSTEATTGLLETLEQMSTSRWPRSLKRAVRGLNGLVDHNDESIALLAARNLGAWRVAGSRETEAVRSSSLNAEVRQALAVAIAKTSGRRSAELLAELASDGDLSIRYAAVSGLAYVDLQQAAGAAAKLLGEDPSGMDPVPVVQSLLRQRNGGQLLSDALGGVEVHPAVLARVNQFHRDTGLLPDELIDRFRRSSSSESLSETLLAEDVQALADEVDALGDAARGELIYRRKNVACTRCHAVGSAGPVIGPNLVAVGAAAKTKYLVQSLLRPNAAIAEHYETRMFLREDGTIQTGIVTFRNEKEVLVRDSAQLGKEVRLAVSAIEEELPGKSLMPAGLADQLTSRAEFLDLVKFLSMLGKPGEYANNERPLLRKWRVIAVPDGGALPVDDADWQPVYSKVSGELPTEDLPPGEFVLARSFVSMLVAGTIELKINEPETVKLWVNGTKVSDPTAPIELGRGRHTLTFGIVPRLRDEGLRVQIEAADNAVRFQPEGGV
jgi:putative heme-binding domain-containing protein